MKEIKEKRKLREKHFLKPNGEMIAYIYDHNVHFLKNGKYEEIDNTLQKKNNALENKRNAFKTIFNNENLLEIQKDNNYIIVNLEQEKDVNPLKEKQKVLFKNILNNTDINYEVIGNQVKEAITLKDRKDIKDQLKFRIKTNLDLKENQGKIEVKSDNNIEFIIEKPFMYDQNGIYNYNIFYELRKNTHDYFLILHLDKKWLLDEARVYPVIIDPTLTEFDNPESLIDTYIYEGDTYASKGTEEILKVGVDTNGKVYRSLLKFSLPSIGTGSQVIDARMILMGYPNFTPFKKRSYIDVHEVTKEWNEADANWEIMHDKYKDRIEYYGTFNENIALPNGSILNPVYDEYDITNLVKKWYSGTPNHGVMLKTHVETKEMNEEVCKYFSKNNKVEGHNAKPVLLVTYRNQNGLESYMTYKSQAFAEGTTYVNNYTGNLTTAFDIISTIGGKNPVSVNLFYNTNDVILENDYGYGLGYKLNFHQTLTEESIEDNPYVLYTDEDGTIHYFYKNGENYKDEDGLELTLSKYKNNYTMLDKDGNRMKFTYANGLWYLTKLITTEEFTTTITYDNKNRIIRITDANDEEINVTYADTGIVFYNGNKTVLININNKGQMTSLEKDDTSTIIEYNNLNIISKITDINGISLNYEYHDGIPYRMKKITEIGLNNELGKEMNIEYGFNVTTFTDELGHKNTYTFNNRGNSISITNLDSTDKLNTAYGKNNFYLDAEGFENKLLGSEQLNKTIKNYILNSSFEENDNYFQVNASEAGFSTDASKSGKRSYKISNGKLGIPLKLLQDKFYTFSAYIKGEGKATLSIETKDTTNKIHVFKEEYDLSEEFERYDITFEHLNNYNQDIVVYIETSSNIYIDDVQLEEGKVANYYNMIDNSDFSEDLKYWEFRTTTQITNEEGFSDVIDVDPRYEIVTLSDNTKALKVLHDPYIAQSIARDFNVSGKAGDTFVVSYWYKNNAVDCGSGYSAHSMIGFGYVEDDEFGGDQEPSFEALNMNETEWQYYSETFIAEKDYNNLFFLLLLENTINDIYITNFTIYKDLRATYYNYDTKGNITGVCDANGEETKFKYDNNNQLLQMINPKGTNYKYEYDNDDPTKMLSGIAQNGISNEIKYDENNNLILTKTKSVKKEDGIPSGKYYIRHKGTNKYFTADFKTKEIYLKESPCSRDVWIITKLPYYRYTIQPAIMPNYYLNENHNQISGGDIFLDKTSKINFEFSPQDNGSYLISTSSVTRDDTGAPVTTDSSGKLITYDGPLGRFETRNYEFYFESAEYPYFIENTAEYTSDGKFIKSTTDTLLNKVEYNIDPATGLTKSVTNPKGITTSYTYNTQEQITSVKENDKTIEYEYNEHQNLSKIKSGAKEYNFTYDNFLNPKSVKIGNNITLITNEYEDRNGNLKQSTYGNNDKITYDYDELNRLKTIHKENENITHEYDNFNNISKVEVVSNDKIDTYKYTYDRSQRLVNYSFNNFRLKYKYDKNSNVTDKTYKLNSMIKTKNFTLNQDDNITLSQMDNTKIEYKYDPLARLEERIINDTYKTKYGYLTNGLRTSTIINSLTEKDKHYYYKYDKLNNITHIYLNDTLTNEYSYDNFNELIKEHDYIENKKVEYTYDTEGNILNKKIYDINTNELVDEKDYEYNNEDWEDQLTNYDGTNIIYDAIGNPIKIGENITFDWKNGRELASYSDIEADLEINYTYNKDGIRTSKIINGVETKYYLENKNILFENYGTNMIYYLRDSNSGLIGLKLNETTYYYQKNIQDDIIGLMDEDFNLVAEYNYDSWGNILSIKDANGNEITDTTHIAHINPFRYRSYYYDKETKLYYLNSRYYNPTWGRFINVDGVINGNRDFIGYNLYAYVSNSFSNATDSQGSSVQSWINTQSMKLTKFTLKTMAKIGITLATAVTQLRYPIASEMLRKSTLGTSNTDFPYRFNDELTKSIRTSKEMKDIIKKEVANANGKSFCNSGVGSFSGFSDNRLGIGKFDYKITGENTHEITKLGHNIWNITVTVSDVYDFKNEHDSGFIIDSLNQFGEDMQKYGVMTEYRWEISYNTMYFEGVD